MPTAHEMRQRLENANTEVIVLRQFEEFIKAPLDEAVARLNTLKQGLPLDVLGEQTGDWASLTPEAQEEQYKRLLSIGKTLEALTTMARHPSPQETHWLLGYSCFLSLALLFPIFLCVCKGALPVNMTASPTDATNVQDDSDAGDQDGETDSPEGVGLEDDGTDGANNAEEEKEEQEQVADSDAQGDGEAESISKSSSGNAARDKPRIHASWMLLLIVCLGAFGGCLRVVSSVVVYIGTRRICRSWLAYYYLAPLESALLAVIICLLVMGGVVELQPANGSQDVSDNASELVPVAPSTLLYFYALAGFSGLFAKNVLRKLRDVCDALFSSPSSHDAAT